MLSGPKVKVYWLSKPSNTKTKTGTLATLYKITVGHCPRMCPLKQDVGMAFGTFFDYFLAWPSLHPCSVYVDLKEELLQCLVIASSSVYVCMCSVCWCCIMICRVQYRSFWCVCVCVCVYWRCITARAALYVGCHSLSLATSSIMTGSCDPHPHWCSSHGVSCSARLWPRGRGYPVRSHDGSPSHVSGVPGGAVYGAAVPPCSPW